MAVLAFAGCGGDPRIETVPVTTDFQPTDDDTSAGDSSEGPSGGLDVAGGCPDARVCDGGCCPDGSLCVAGQCVADCGGTPACGVDETCCADGELCWLGECVVPGSVCTQAACATLVEGSCEEDEVCETTLGRCVPKLAGESCTYVPPPAEFDPIPLFTWGERRERACSVDADCQTAEDCNDGSCEVTWPHHDIDEWPDFKQVIALPVVADLDRDCVPEIVFSSYRQTGIPGNSVDGVVLRAIRGDTGDAVWTMSNQQFAPDYSAAPAIGDLDDDGQAEIVVKGTGSFLVAFDSNGTPLWISDEFAEDSADGAVAIANLDGEGEPELVLGAAVFDAFGSLLWEGGLGNGFEAANFGVGPLSCVADVTGDGRPELIGGHTAYTFAGTVQGGDFVGDVLWSEDLLDGYCAVADFDGDLAAEIVLVDATAGEPNDGHVHVLDGATGTVLASLAVPSLTAMAPGHGGAPNIADFDGDGRPDIGTAAARQYTVMTFDGTELAVLWRAPTEDDSSQRTGSSVFDFDGDGRAEVIYNDEEYLRIYPGVEPDCAAAGPGCDGVMTDAELLFRDLSSSRTRSEYPVVADVDGDFKAELVIVTNNEASFLDVALLADAGLEVWNDRLDHWVPTRPIWNQHAYHIDNVGVAGDVPAQEQPTAEGRSSYRRNTQGEVQFCAPDLEPADLAVDCVTGDLSAWIVNRGCLGVGAGVQVAFYDGAGALLGVATTDGPIVAGGARRVTLVLPEPLGSDQVFWVAVDDDGTGMGAKNECVEDNNASGMQQGCKPVG